MGTAAAPCSTLLYLLWREQGRRGRDELPQLDVRGPQLLVRAKASTRGDVNGASGRGCREVRNTARRWFLELRLRWLLLAHASSTGLCQNVAPKRWNAVSQEHDRQIIFSRYLKKSCSALAHAQEEKKESSIFLLQSSQSCRQRFNHLRSGERKNKKKCTTRLAARHASSDDPRAVG